MLSGTSIGVIHSPYTNPKDAPIQPVYANDQSVGRVVVDRKYADCLKDIEGFERIWLLYWFHEAGQCSQLVTPYLDQEKHGVFATRYSARPNSIGFSSVRLTSRDGCVLFIAEVDILDQTPLLDIKPYIKEFDCFDTQRHGWWDRATA
jgi:tRNA-Thr(GGU) m(6)t(6)A37 methyltransferase TsaA